MLISQGHQSLRGWILIASGLIALLEIAVSLALCFSPASVVDSVDLDAKGVDYLIYMWAARQFALGAIFAYATWKRSIPMLTLAFIFFLIMMIGDTLIGVVQKDNGLIFAGLVMCMVSVGMIYLINKRR